MFVDVRVRLHDAVVEMESWWPPSGDPIRTVVDAALALLTKSPSALDPTVQGVRWHLGERDPAD